MKTIYLDVDFRCRVTDDDTRKAVETDVFDGKCDAYIEGFRFVPAGETWMRGDGEVFTGEMIAPWKDDAELDAAQREHERKQLEEAKAVVNELIGGVEDVQHE